jgi:hypothetical protein
VADEQRGEPSGLVLTEEERKRIRAEMRYAMLSAQEARPAEKPKTRLDTVLGYLSNGFFLLVVGSLITSVLVPRFQREYESRANRSALMQECLTQFLLYSNSIWQEYYAILPLTLEPEIDKNQYVRSMNEISQIKLKRYDAYAKTQALALVFRDEASKKPSPAEEALNEYAIHMNAVSEEIDTWLSDLYCTPTKRLTSPCATFDPSFEAYERYTRLKDLVIDIGNKGAQKVAGLMVERIKSPH